MLEYYLNLFDQSIEKESMISKRQQQQLANAYKMYTVW